MPIKLYQNYTLYTTLIWHSTFETVSFTVTVAKPSASMAVNPLIVTCLKSGSIDAVTLSLTLDVAVKLYWAFNPLVCTVNGTVTELSF